MRVPESWLASMIHSPGAVDLLADRLTMAGLEVEEISAQAPEFSGVVVAKVMDVQKHPDADRLRVCKVNAGVGFEQLQIVCGAPNVSAGMMAACAREGAELPGGFRIKRAKMRGVESQGMLCSAKELGIAEDAQGLMVLPQELSGQIGADLRDTLGLNEKVLTLKLTPNRADCLSIAGIAREVSVLTGQKVSLPAYSPVAVKINDSLSVKVSSPDLCGRFAGRVIKNVNPRAQTPAWMKDRLSQSGQRPISALVDISNYVMLELGQPSHIFDLDRIKGGLEVRWAKPKESLRLLNDQAIELDSSVGVIADENGPQSMAGIMGGAATAVDDATLNIFVEMAFWWPDAIRGRARRFNFVTEAGHRFERGVDWESIPSGLEYITYLIESICGGSAGPVQDEVLSLPTRAPVVMRMERCAKVLGVRLDVGRCTEIFERLGFSPRLIGEDRIEVTPPSYRFDIQIEEDLIEEVARVYGFEQIPAKPPVSELIMSAKPEHRRDAMQIRDRMVAADYTELITYSFISPQDAQRIDPSGGLALLNPMASHQSVMRPSLLPGMLSALCENINRKQSRVRIFEIGRTFHEDATVTEGEWTVRGVSQPVRLAALAYGPVLEEQWGAPLRLADFFDLKADLQSMALPLDLQARGFEGVPPAFLHPGRSAELFVSGRPAGLIGELHPAITQQLGLSVSPVLAELILEHLLDIGLPRPHEPSKFPPVSRDVALVVDVSVPSGAIYERLNSLKNQLKQGVWIQNIICFDEYRGKGLSDKEKSLGFRFILQSSESTLQDAEVDILMSEVLGAMEKDFSARLRH